MTDTPSTSPEQSTEIAIRKNNAFSLDESDILKIQEIASNISTKIPEVEAEFSDDVTRKFTSISDLLKYTGSGKSRLKRLKIRLFQSSPVYRRFSLELGGEPNVLAYIAADENSREVAVRELLGILSRAKPWYTWFSGWSPWILSLLPGLAAAVSTILNFVQNLAFDPKSPNAEKQIHEMTDWNTRFLVVSITLCILAFPLDKLRRVLFPSTVFLICGEERLNRKVEIWRQVVVASLLGVLLTAALTLIWGLIANTSVHH